MNDPADITALLEAAADRVGPVVTPAAAGLVTRARARRRSRRLTGVAIALAVAVCAGTLVVRLDDHGGSRRVSTIGPTPGGGATPADLARFAWSDLPPAPIATRTEAAMGWTGQDLVVWGGGTRDGMLLGDGAAFDPVHSRWRKIATPPPALPLRYSPRTVWTGHELLVLGGHAADNNGSAAGVGGAYDPATDQWRVLPGTASDAELALSATWTGQEAVVVTAGRSTSAYDPATNRWRSLAPLPEPPERDLQRLVPVWTGSQLLVWAEWAQSIQLGPGSFSLPWGIDLFSLDVATGQWTARPRPPNEPLGIDAAYWTGQNVVLPAAQLFRGYGAGPATTGRSGSRYDPTADSYAPITLGPVDDGAFGGVWAGGALVIVSQRDESGPGTSLKFGDTAAWDPVRDTWTKLRRAPTAIAGPDTQMVWTGTEILAYGPHPSRFGPA